MPARIEDQPFTKVVRAKVTARDYDNFLKLVEVKNEDCLSTLLRRLVKEAIANEPELA